MSGLIYIGGGKGGTAKTSTSHLGCLGAVLRNFPATYVLTDPERELRKEGRPYGVLDGKHPEDLANIIAVARMDSNAWVFIDGGGNRPAFDKVMASQVDLVVLPFCASQEDIDTLFKDMESMPEAVALPSAWTTNPFAERTAQDYLDQVSRRFPGRVMSKIPFVNSSAEVLAKSLGSPATTTRTLARKVFATIEDWFIDHIDEARDERDVVPARKRS